MESIRTYKFSKADICELIKKEHDLDITPDNIGMSSHGLVITIKPKAEQKVD